MERGYEGWVAKNTYFLTKLLLKYKLFFTGLGKSVKTYWDEDESAPMVEVNSSELSHVHKLKPYPLGCGSFEFSCFNFGSS